MNELTISQLEKYILANNKADILKEVTPYSASYHFLSIMNEFLQPSKSQSEIDSMIETFLKNKNIPQEKKKLIKLKYLLGRIADNKSNLDEQKKLLDEFNEEFLNVNFDYASKTQGPLASTLTQKHAQTVKSSLSGEDLRSITLDHLLEEFYKKKNEEALDKIVPSFYHKINLSKFSVKMDANIIKKILSKHPDINSIPGLVDILKQKTSQGKSLLGDVAYIWSLLDITNKEKLLEVPEFKLNQEFIISYVKDKFNFAKLDNEEQPIPEKIDTWTQMRAYFEQLPDKYKNYISIILLKLIKLNSDLGVYDEKLLVEFLRNPGDHKFKAFRKKLADKKGNEDQNNQSLWWKFTSTSMIMEKIFPQYLQKILVQTKDFNAYLEFFEEKELRVIYATAMLTSGKQLPDVDSMLSQNELKDLHFKKQLSFAANPPKFSGNDRVAIGLQLKNIVKMNVRVFEVNTLNYLLETESDRFEKVDVTGLIPIEEYNYNFNQEPIIIHEEEFEFPGIQAKEKGVFIIDFIGDQLTARTIIHKGSLTVVNDSQSGRNCVIVDNSGRICLGKETGIYIGGTFFEADPVSGVVSIPLNVASFSKNVVVVHQGFASLSSLTIKNPTPALTFTPIFNAESLISGNQVDLVIQAKLSMNDQLVSLSKLLNASVVLRTTTAEGLQNQVNFKDLKFRDSEDLIISFIYPQKVQALSIELTGNVKIGSEIEKLQANQTIKIEVADDFTIERFFFRKNNKNEIFMEALGRNGEPIPNKPVQVEIELNFSFEVHNFSLVTDEKGRVYFGSIEHIKSITKTDEVGVFYSEKSKDTSIYVDRMIFIENEAIEIPLLSENKKIKLCTKQTLDNKLIYDLTSSHVRLCHKVISIAKLEAGSYTLAIGPQLIDILVLKGEYFELNGQNIRTKTGILPFSKVNEFFLSKTHTDSNGDKYVEVSTDSDIIKAHLLTYNFLPCEKQLLEQFITKSNDWQKKYPRMEFLLKEKANIYQSGGRLSDEVIYVLSRRHKPNFMGNTLEKPGMILKRNKLKQTSESKDELNAGINCRPDNSGVGAYPQLNSNMLMSRLVGGCNPATNHSLIRTIPFLKNPGKIYSNLEISDNKVILPSEAFSSYSHAFLVLSNGEMTSLIEVSSSEKAIVPSDCRLLESKKSGYIVSFERKVTGILKDQSIRVTNIKNTEICVIDNFANLFETLQLLAERNADQLTEWEFLKDWNNLDPMEKLKKYDKMASHEFNLFLAVKDREFFDGVVKPFIINKKEKQLIDFYLLQDERNLSRFYNFSSFEILNKLELVLLAQASRVTNQDFSNSILKYLKNSSNLQKLTDVQKARIFDPLISSRGENDKEGKEKEKKDSFSNKEKMLESARMEPPPPPAPVSEKRFAHFSAMDRGVNLNHLSRDANILEGSVARFSGLIRSKKRSEGWAFRNEEEKMEMVEEKRNLDSLELKTQTVDIFIPSEGTIEYNEKKYWNMTLKKTIQPFWSELADHLVSTGSFENFISQNFIYDVSSFSDCFSMLTFIDLSFDKVKFSSSIDNSDLIITAPNNLVLLSKEIIEKEGEKLDVNVLCAQRFFDPLDLFVYDDENPLLRVDKKVDEFIINKVYGCRVVVTNCMSADLSLNIMHEVPQGAIPITSTDFLKVNNKVLSSLQSEIFEFHFYFPAVGSFTIYPATVTAGSRIVAIAQVDSSIIVKETKTIRNLETINDILSMGNTNDIIDFIQNKNILNNKVFDFGNIYWLLKNKDFYEKLIAALRVKGIYEQTVWSFSLYHGDLPTLQEYLTQRIHTGEFGFAKYVKSDILSIDRFEIREYYPLINKRAHSVTTEKVNIFNNSFKETYTKFLSYLFEKGELESEDWLLFANYLLAQDRFEEAIQIFNKIAPESKPNLETKIQRDYLMAYIDFITGYPEFNQAKKICEEYLTYPVLTWRNLFIEMANQIAEFEESGLIQIDAEAKIDKPNNTKKALKGPTLHSELEGEKIKISYRNIEALKIEFFKVDIEILFSLNPFEVNSSKSYSHVRPFAQETLTLTAAGDYVVTHYNIPADFAKENLFIQLSYNEKGIANSQFISYVPFKLHHQLSQEFGIIKLIDPQSIKPVPKIYVKCFVKYKTGKVAFYKDGYTDLRGSFDYVSLNKDEVDDVQKFALLVAGGDFGYKILEIDPPKKIGRVEGEAKKLVSNNWANMQMTYVRRPGLSKYAKCI